MASDTELTISIKAKTDEFVKNIHMRQSELYGELISTDHVELFAREIEAMFVA